MILNTLDNLGKFEAKGEEGYFIGYSMSSKAFRVFHKRTKIVEKNLHVDFLENKAIEKRTGPNWLFDIESLTKSMNYVPVVVVGINSTNLSGTKDATSQEVKKDASSLRYIALPNWVHDALLESPSNDQMETLTVETPIPTVSSPVPTACFKDSPEPTTTTKIISKRVTSQDETPSLDTISTLANRFVDILGVTTSTVDSHGEEADEEGIDYDEVFAPIARIKAIRLFLAYASFMGFTVYQMDVKSAFLYGTIDEEVTVPLFDSMLVPHGEGSRTPTEPYHTPSPEAQQTSPTTHSSLSLPTVPTEPLPTIIPTDTAQLRQYIRRARIAQSLALPLDRANIPKTSTLPSDSTPMVTSLAADEGSMQQKLDELMTLCISLQREQSEMISKIAAQELEINSLKARIKLLEDKDGGVVEQSGDDAPIKGRRLDEGEDAAKRVSDDTEEMATVLTSIDAVCILTSGGVQVVPTTVEVATATVSIPTGSGVVSTASPATLMLLFSLLVQSLPRTQEEKEEAERFKRKGPRLEQESVKKLKTSEEVKATEEVPEEKVKEMMQLVPVEEVYVEALQVNTLLLTGRPRYLHANREGLPSEEGSGNCDDQLQASSGDLLSDGK
nr:putative ribonuclease H-like domain-containing protein [Tanacetum cinerariifolium]